MHLRNTHPRQNPAKNPNFISLDTKVNFFILYYLIVKKVRLKKIKVHEKGTIRAKILPEFSGYISPYRNGDRPKRETRPVTNRSG